MKFGKENMLLYAVTDRAWVGKMTLLEQVEAALQNGVTCVQLREKQLDVDAFQKEAMEIGRLCRRYGVPFLINDNLDIAIAYHADDVHMGQSHMAVREVRRRVGSSMIVGASAHSVAEAREAEESGADYLGIGAVFSTTTKTNVTAMPYETLKSICAAVSIPKVAIGGISQENLMALSGSGVDGVAVVSAIFGAEDPGAAAARLRALAETMVKTRMSLRGAQRRGNP